MGGSNPISKAASWATKQAGGGTFGRIVGNTINADPMVRIAQGRGVEQNLLKGKPLDAGTNYLLGTETPGLTPEQEAARNEYQAYVTAPGAMGEVDAALLHDRYMGANAINSYKQSRSAEINKLLGSAMEQAKGLSGLENAAIRSNALSSINAQNQGALKALRASQAASGVRGGLAAAQMAQQQGEAAKALGTFERDLVADNINYKREGTKTALEAVTNQENVERDLAAQKLNTVLAIRAENASLKAAEMQANAAAQAGRRGGKGGK